MSVDLPAAGYQSAAEAWCESAGVAFGAAEHVGGLLGGHGVVDFFSVVIGVVGEVRMSLCGHGFEGGGERDERLGVG
ncbi:hypothetical protein GTA09_15315 [Rhodococcus hoagii]|nr:hypothetical protein [Prescottella equi]NKZ71064.1 hypothetical protein [Prescottella equi]